MHTCHNQATKKPVYAINVDSFFFFFWIETQLFSQSEKRYNHHKFCHWFSESIHSYETNKKKINCQHDCTQNNWFNWILSSSVQLPFLRTQHREVFRSYVLLSPKLAIVVCQSVIHTTSYPKGPQKQEALTFSSLLSVLCIKQIGKREDLAAANSDVFTLGILYSIHTPLIKPQLWWREYNKLGASKTLHRPFSSSQFDYEKITAMIINYHMHQGGGMLLPDLSYWFTYNICWL